MRVGFDITAAVYHTGVGDYVENLVSQLPTDQLRLFGMSLRRRSELEAIFPSAQVLPIPPKLASLIWNQFHVVNIERLIGKIDVLHSSDWIEPPSQAKKLTTIHDLSPLALPEETSLEIVNTHTAKLRWTAKECQAVICVSHFTASEFTRLFPKYNGKVVVIPEALPARFNISPQNFHPAGEYLVAIGARQPRKNINRLIRAFTQFKSKLGLPEKLIIIGEPPLTHPTFPGVEFTGFVSNQHLVNLLAGAQALVHPSLYEGFGLPILEAFHFGIPVACSNTSSLPEVAGDAATYFDPLNEESIALAILATIKAAPRLVDLGKHQLAKFSWQNTADLTMKVYNSLC